MLPFKVICSWSRSCVFGIAACSPISNGCVSGFCVCVSCGGRVMCKNLFEAVSLTQRWWHILLAPAQGPTRISPESSAVTLWILNFFVPSHPFSSVFQSRFSSFTSSCLHPSPHPTLPAPSTLIPLSFLLHISAASIIQSLGPSRCITNNRCLLSVK